MTTQHDRMKNSFLIGGFLPGREGVFRYRRGRPAQPAFSPEALQVRFASRSSRMRLRRARYWIKVQSGYVVALVLLIGAFRMPIRETQNFEIKMAEQELVELEEIVQTEQLVRPPAPPRPPVPVEVPDDEILDDDELLLDATLDLAEVLDVPPPPPPAQEDEDDFDENEIFVAVEHVPEILGGVAHLQSLVEYPAIARKAQMEGTVVVRVIVNTNGLPSDPEVLRSAGAVLDAAATEAVMKLKFKPGMQRNRAVRTMMAIPVKFKLS